MRLKPWLFPPYLKNRMFCRLNMFSLLASLIHAHEYPPTTGLEIGLTSDPKFEQQYPMLLNSENPNVKVYEQCNNANAWALTFDDGPEMPTNTVLDYLGQQGIKVTFFVVGFRVRDFRSILKRAYDEGHQIGIHSWSHSHLPQLTNGQIMTELLYTRQIIQEVIGEAPLLMRPPYGEVDDKAKSVIDGLGMTIVNWNRDTRDASDQPLGLAGIKIQVDRWFNQTSNGISLAHDFNPEYVKGVPYSVERLLAKGVDFVTVGDCIGKAAYGELKEAEPAPVTTTTTATSAKATKVPKSLDKTTISSVIGIYSNTLLSLMMLFGVLVI
jgi:peptidoglycan/xylan/chitin deacetylase (PgdA/CDA1 family)